MKRVLVLSSYCFDNASTNGLCALALVNALRSKGLEVGLLGYGEKNSALQKSCADGDFTVSSVREDLYQNKKTTKFSVLKNVFRSFFEPLYDRKLVSNYYALAKELIRMHSYDAVIAMYFPMEPIKVASCLKKDFHELFFASYELDSATDGIQSVGRLAKIQHKVHIRWLKRIYKKIDTVFVMQSHAEHAKKLYGDILGEKLVVTDLPVLTEKSSFKAEQTEETRFLYAGILDRVYRSPKVLLDLFSQNPDFSDWRMDFFSKGNCEEDLRKAAERDSRICCHGYVPADELDRAIDRSEVLVSIGNANSNSVPSKIINYISYGKPIVHFSLQKNDVCSRYFGKYPLALVIPFGTDSRIATDMIKAFVAKQKGKRIPFSEIKQSFEENLPEYSAELIVRFGDRS